MNNDLWTLTSDMMLRLANNMVIKTEDNLYYTIHLNDENNTIIAVVKKVYIEHNKYVTYQSRNESYSIKQDDLTKVNVAKLEKNIQIEKLLIEINKL